MRHPSGVGERPPRLRTLADLCTMLAALVVMLVAIYAGLWATTLFVELSRGLKQDRLYHEHLLQQHRQELKDH